MPWVIEVTTFRSDAYARHSRKPAVAFGDTLDGDLVRRDFTVNAMAVSIRARRSSTRTAGWPTWPRGRSGPRPRPEISFSDDPLRMMRAARFAAQLGFVPAPEVVAAMTAMADRISDHLRRAGPRRAEPSCCWPTEPRPGLDLMVATGLADRVLPELPALRLERDEHHRHKDVYQHSLTVLEQAIELESRLPERTEEGVPAGPT